MPATSHPTPATLQAYGQGRLSAGEMTAIEAHLATCDRCCEALAGTPDDTLLVRAREAATSGFRAREQTVAEKPASPREIPPPLRNHPRYRVLGLLGTGGMGAVYKAEHRLMERMVALKVINPALVSSPAALERFEREVKTAAKLSHPNIVAAHDAEQAGGLHFLVMEFVEGVSLDRLVASRGPLAPQLAAHLIRQAAQGLQHAHTKGMIHRDIKPQNLMVAPPKWDLKILDFGLARLASQAWQSSAETATDSPDRAPDRPDNATRAGSILGTPDYIAPEQATDAYLADIRADIYSLGCTLYFLLAGEPPFPGGTLLDKLHAHKTSTPTPIRLRRPEVPEELERILDRALAKNPADRYATPEEFAKALLPIARSKTSPTATAPNTTAAGTVAETVAAEPDFPALDLALPAVPSVTGSKSRVGSPRKLRRPASLRPGLLIASVALGIAVLLGVLWPLLNSQPEKKPEQSGVKKNSGKSGEAQNLSGSSSGKKKLGNQSSLPPAFGPTPDNHKPLLIVLPQYSLYYPDFTYVRDALNERSRKYETVSLEGKPVSFYAGQRPATVTPDHALTPAIVAANYSAIIFVGHFATELCEDPGRVQIERLLTEFKRDQKPIAGICAGQGMLAEHQQLSGKRVALSSEANKRAAYRNSGLIEVPNRRVHVDDLLVTGAADVDGPAFVDALLARLRGEQSGSR